MIATSQNSKSTQEIMLKSKAPWRLGNNPQQPYGKFSKLPAFFPKLVAKVYTNIIFMI
jgi:hypothetical protein